MREQLGSFILKARLGIVEQLALFGIGEMINQGIAIDEYEVEALP
ncbi:MAG: hypothetical protein P1V97_27760 [Planctomycetota bacterium]|nr:hypothetical protein [Planctomycetota bacterium]